jgi:hypothetical protein
MKYLLILILGFSLITPAHALEQKTIDTVYGTPPKLDLELPTGWEERSQPKYDNNGTARGMFEFNSTHIFVDYKSKAKFDEEAKAAVKTTPQPPKDYYVLSANGHNDSKPVQITIDKNGSPQTIDTATYVYIPSLKQICSNDKIQAAPNNWYEIRYGSYYYYFQATSKSNVTIDTQLYSQSIANNLTSYTPPLAKSYAICWDKPISQEELNYNSYYTGQDSLNYLFSNTQLGDAIIQFKVCTSISNRDFNEVVDKDVLTQLRKVVGSLKKSDEKKDTPTQNPTQPKLESISYEDLKYKSKSYKDKEVELEFIQHCNGWREFTKSKIPAPELYDIEQLSKDNQYTIHGSSITAGQKLKVRVRVDKCNFFGWKESESWVQSPEGSKVESVKFKAYKDTLQLKDEDITSGNVDNPFGFFSFDVLKREIDWRVNDEKVWDRDKLYAKSYISGQIEMDLGQGYGKQKLEYGSWHEESPESNRITLKDVMDYDEAKNIESDIKISGKDSDVSGVKNYKTDQKKDDSEKSSFERVATLKFIKESDRSKYNQSYDKTNKPKLWIISHGWCDTRSSFEPMARSIAEYYPDNIVMTLDWSEMGFNDCGTCFSKNCPAGVRRAATWIGPTAQQVALKLQDWGFEDGNNLRVVGHSLGSIMSGEISKNTSNKAAKLIALDPPSESKWTEDKVGGVLTTIVGVTIGSTVPDELLNFTYEVIGINPYKVNNTNERSIFKEYAQSSKAFYGRYSFAGNRVLASTANESYEIDYHFNDYFEDSGEEHQFVTATFKRMINDINFVDEDTKSDRVLDLNDIWKDHGLEWQRNVGRKNTDHGQINGNKPDDIINMKVKLKTVQGFKFKKYVKI